MCGWLGCRFLRLARNWIGHITAMFSPTPFSPESRCQLLVTPGWLPTRPSQAKVSGAGSPGNSRQALSSQAGGGRGPRAADGGLGGGQSSCSGIPGTSRKHHSEALMAVGTFGFMAFGSKQTKKEKAERTSTGPRRPKWQGVLILTLLSGNLRIWGSILLSLGGCGLA